MARFAVALLLQILCCGCPCVDDDVDWAEMPRGAEEEGDPNFDPYAKCIASYKFEWWTTREERLDADPYPEIRAHD